MRYPGVVTANSHPMYMTVYIPLLVVPSACRAACGRSRLCHPWRSIAFNPHRAPEVCGPEVSRGRPHCRMRFPSPVPSMHCIRRCSATPACGQRLYDDAIVEVVCAKPPDTGQLLRAWGPPNYAVQSGGSHCSYRVSRCLEFPRDIRDRCQCCSKGSAWDFVLYLGCLWVRSPVLLGEQGPVGDRCVGQQTSAELQVPAARCF